MLTEDVYRSVFLVADVVMLRTSAARAPGALALRRREPRVHRGRHARLHALVGRAQPGELHVRRRLDQPERRLLRARAVLLVCGASAPRARAGALVDMGPSGKGGFTTFLGVALLFLSPLDMARVRTSGRPPRLASLTALFLSARPARATCFRQFFVAAALASCSASCTAACTCRSRACTGPDALVESEWLGESAVAPEDRPGPARARNGASWFSSA